MSGQNPSGGEEKSKGKPLSNDAFPDLHPDLMSNPWSSRRVIGQHELSYERTKFPEEDVTTATANESPSISKLTEAASTVDRDVEMEDVKEAGSETNSVPSDLPSESNKSVCVKEEEADEEIPRDNIPAHPRPIKLLPPVPIIFMATPNTRVRHTSRVIMVGAAYFIEESSTALLRAAVCPKLVANQLHDVTTRHPQIVLWGETRYCRPHVLFMLYPRGAHAYGVATGRRSKPPVEFRPRVDAYDRILLSLELKPLKHSLFMPRTVGSKIPGWEIEALCRLDTTLSHQDFIDRMAPQTAEGKKPPNKGSLNHRRRRARMEMRMLPWPVPRTLTYSDHRVLADLDEWGRAHNSTRYLRDLTRQEMELQDAVLYGGHLERSGRNAVDDRRRLEKFRQNLIKVRRAFGEASEEVAIVTARAKSLLEKMGIPWKDSDWRDDDVIVLD